MDRFRNIPDHLRLKCDSRKPHDPHAWTRIKPGQELIWDPTVEIPVTTEIETETFFCNGLHLPRSPWAW